MTKVGFEIEQFLKGQHDLFSNCKHMWGIVQVFMNQQKRRIKSVQISMQFFFWGFTFKDVFIPKNSIQYLFFLFNAIKKSYPDSNILGRLFKWILGRRTNMHRSGDGRLHKATQINSVDSRLLIRRGFFIAYHKSCQSFFS